MPTMSKEYNQAYYLAHKEKQKAYMKHEILCVECGKLITRSNMTNHKNTKKHIKAVEHFFRNDSVEKTIKLI
jgi:hypothetical protein